jgi:hypothetical protein
VNLFWRITGPQARVPSLEIGGPSAARSDPAAPAGWRETGLADVLPTSQWPMGVIEDRRRLAVPPATRAGIAAISVGGLKLGEVEVTEPQREFALPAMQHDLGLPVGDFATLAGYTLEPLQPGLPLRLTLVWQDRMPTATSYKVFVHVLDGANQVVAQRDDAPRAGAMPTTFWVPNQVVADSYDVPLAGPLPPGAQLEIGMYEPGSGKRVAIGPDDHVLLPLSR